MNNQTEVAIIGGGLAGLTAAIHLLQQGLGQRQGCSYLNGLLDVFYQFTF